MAQNSTDFSSYTTGIQPSDWTKIWYETCTWTVQTAIGESLPSAYGTKVLKGDASSLDRTALYWTVPGSQSDVDIKIRARSYASGYGRIGIGARMRVVTGVKYGYHLYFYVDTNELVLERLKDGIITVLSTYETDSEILYLGYNTWYCVRLQISGTSIKGKIWKADADEPITWQIETTDNQLPDAGYAGVVFMADGYCDWFGIGDGGSAPPAFPATEGDGRLTQAVVEISRKGAPKGRLTQAVIEAFREGAPGGRLTQAVIEVIRGKAKPQRNFLVFDIRHDLNDNKIAYKCIELPELLP